MNLDLLSNHMVRRRFHDMSDDISDQVKRFKLWVSFLMQLDELTQSNLFDWSNEKFIYEKNSFLKDSNPAPLRIRFSKKFLNPNPLRSNSKKSSRIALVGSVLSCGYQERFGVANKEITSYVNFY